jgi:hypothetical protein
MQLDLGLKEQVRGAAPKSVRTGKNLFCSMRYWQSGIFFFIIHELSVPAQQPSTAPFFWTPPQQILRAFLAECSRWRGSDAYLGIGCDAFQRIDLSAASSTALRGFALKLELDI